MLKIPPPPADIALHLRGLTAAGIRYEVASDLPWPGMYFGPGRTVLVRDDLSPQEYGLLVSQVMQQVLTPRHAGSGPQLAAGARRG